MKGPAVLTSDVINEAQALFQARAAKKEGYESLISQNDGLYILRGIGMNPTAADLEEMMKEMSPYDPDEKKDDKKKKKQETEAEKKKKKEEEEKDKAPAFQLPEDVQKYTWLSFIEGVELCYKNHRRCEEEIVEAFKVFDMQDFKGRLPLSQIVAIMTQLGDDVLAQPEVEELKRIFGDPEDPAADPEIEFADFAKTMQEGQRPPPPPPALEDTLSGSRKDSNPGM